MRKLFSILAFTITIAANAQQGPGLIISEVLANPAGTDSPFEFVELVATRSINFATTPYTVIACNNGSATTLGWINGGAITYAFQISSGSVVAGDVVYVGGSSMAITGTILRSINTGTTNGDTYGNFNTGGVVGNGGTNADGIGVFASPVASITSTTVPVDAIFYGTVIGTALVNTGLDGYQLPVNDMYPGGKLQTTSLLGPDPASAQYLFATGTFNPTTGAFTTGRTWANTATLTDATTSVTLSSIGTTPALTFAATHATVNESAGTASFTVNVTGSNNGQAVFTLGALPYSTAVGADYTSNPVTVTLAAGVSGPQVITVPIVNDAIAEKDEYIAFYFTGLYNCTGSATAVYHLYIKDNDTPTAIATNELFLDSLSTFSNGVPVPNTAEIVAHDPSTQRLYIANSGAAKLDIVNFSNPASPTLITTINISAYGNINSVAVNDSIVALAIENSTNPQDSGKVVFLDYNGVFIKQVKVGAMPDMITFNHAGTKVITPCEGEPNSAYTNDPDGSVCIVDISVGVANVTQSNVTFVTFTSFNGQEAALRAQGIRIYGVSGIASKDFEPEYVTLSDNDSIAWVTLQENNAIAKINMQTNLVTQIIPLGYKNYMTGPAALDASDNTSAVNLMNAPVFGMYQPDAISHYSVGNQIYLITANEGDSRAYTGLNEESRISGLNLDATAFPYATQMKQNTFLGRLNATNRLGDTDNDGDIDQIYVYGGRSFSIWNGTTGSQVYDSNDQLERTTANHPIYGPLFNMSNGLGAGTAKNRSDDKGPEPEGTAVGNINGEQYVFLALERIGGVIMYNVSNPVAPTYTGYYNHRTVTGGPDRGAEGIIYIADSLSPNGNAIVIAANEISSTLSIFQVTPCTQRAGVTVTPSAPSPVCAGNTVTLTGTTVSNTTYQWYMNGSPIVGATTATYTANATGNYQLMIVNSTNACSGKTDFVNVIVNPLPTVVATSTVTAVCAGSSATLNGAGAATYNWMPGNINGASVAVTPTVATTYTVTGTTALGCTNTSTISIAVNALPTVVATSTPSSICSGASASLTGSGASTFTWMPGSLSGTTVSVAPTANTTYTITGTDALGCINTSTVTVTVLSRPTVTASSSVSTVCNGNSATLTSGGASTYNWQPVNSNGVSVSVAPSANTTYTVTGTATNGCTNTATVTVAVIASPTVTATTANPTVCEGNAVTLNGSGAVNYTWFPGLLTGQNVTTVPSATTTYTLTGFNASGCQNSATVTVTVDATPSLTTTGTTEICTGSSTTLNVAGALSYVWMPTAATGNSITVQPTSNQTYTVIGTASNGCSDSTFIPVTVNQNPTVVTSGSTIVCENAQTTLSVSGATTYLWMPGAATGSSLTVQLSANETYTVTGTDANGCVDSATVSITVNANPTAALTVASDTVCSIDGSVLLTGSPAGGAYSGNSVAGNNFTPSTAPLGSNAIDYVYVDVNGCSDTATTNIFVDVCTAIEANTLAVISAYPNPFSDNLTIRSSEVIEYVEVYNASGQLLITHQAQATSAELNMSGCASGIYFVRVITAKETKVITATRL